MIKFDEKNHKYFDSDGLEYMSVTTLLGKLFPFDAHAVAEKISQNPNSSYYGWDKKKIFADWSKAAREGNKLHHACEVYLKEQKITDNEIMKPCVEQFARLRFTGDILAEQRVYHEDYLLAGTVDILEDCGKHFFLWDIKTSKKMDDDRLKKYSLQLEIYKRLVEKRYCKPCRIGGIIFFDGFVKNREKTKLVFHKAWDVASWVDEILENRLKEIEKKS